MAEIWRTRDYFGRDVSFTEASLDHILQRHEDMAAYLGDIRAVVSQPTIVTKDLKYRRRENHYGRSSPEAGLIKVVQYRPVPPQGRWDGEVITAFRVRKPDSLEEPLTS